MLKLNNKTNKYVHTKYIMYAIISLLIISTLLIASSITYNSTSAMSYQSSNNIEFNLNPTISISITGGDLSIANLVPGSVSDSNAITVGVSSNAISGYTLSSTVGTTDNLSNALRRNGTDTTNKFTSLNSNQSSLNDFSDNEWGYSYCNNTNDCSGTTNWISGNTGTTSTGYNGYTYTTESQSITHLDTSTPGSSSIQYKIGAKASNTQLAGNYTNTINFTAVAKPGPTTFYSAFAAAGKQQYNGYYTMQDMSSEICSAVNTKSVATLIDTRDNEVYYVGKLADGNCWMLDNLRLGGDSPITLTSQDTNIAAATWELPVSINNNFDSYTKAQINADYKNNLTTSYGVTGSGKIGVYYNYCAASAGTYCYNSESGIDLPDTLVDSPYDVCPANWRMPTTSSDASSEYRTLCDILWGSECKNYATMSATNPNSIQYNLSLLLSGYFLGDEHQFINVSGHYWSSTYGSSGQMRRFYISGYSIASESQPRNDGFSIRCLLDS